MRFHSERRSFRKILSLPIRMLLIIITCVPAIDAQQNQGFKIKVDTQLVVTSVIVKDKNGANIEGLTARDFVLSEDDAIQEISVFEFNRFDDAPAAAVLKETLPEQMSKGLDPASSHRIASDFQKPVRYQNRRLLVLFFDMTSMQKYDLYQSLLAGKKFIQMHMTGADLISIVAYVSGAIQTLTDFTDDRNALLEILDKRIYDRDEDKLFNTSAFGQDSSEFNLFNTDRRLAALQTTVEMLKQVKEKKYLVYFASGLRLNQMENQAQMRATINAAVRANVAFFPIDARGLEAFAPMGDASQPSSGGIGMYTGELAMEKLTLFQSSQDSLYALAADTGGKAMLDNNNLTDGIVSAQKSTTGYYTIGYYPTNNALDGKFRRIKIALREFPSTKLEFRNGYYAGKIFGKFNEFEKERQLEEALMLGDPITEIPIAMEVNYFKLNSAEYFVPVHVKMPGSELLLAGGRGADRSRMDFIGEVKDNYGNTIRNMRDKVDIKLGKERIQELAKQPIQYDTGFTLLPGKYVIKFLARNAETGRIGTYETSFAVPNLMKASKTIPISSVVLGNQLVDMHEAIYNAAKGKNADAQFTNPLVVQGNKLIPSVTRVFSKSREMFIYLQAYSQNTSMDEPIVAYATFYRNRTKAFETAPVAIAGGADAQSDVLPLRLSISLSNLEQGEYSLQVTVLDPTGRKVAFWQAPVMITP
jgi:VWFA-related protein